MVHLLLCAVAVNFRSISSTKLLPWCQWPNPDEYGEIYLTNPIKPVDITKQNTIKTRNDFIGYTAYGELRDCPSMWHATGYSLMVAVARSYCDLCERLLWWQLMWINFRQLSHIQSVPWNMQVVSLCFVSVLCYQLSIDILYSSRSFRVAPGQLPQCQWNNYECKDRYKTTIKPNGCVQVFGM